MKLRIKISGHRVHDVGYRVFLLKHAMKDDLKCLVTGQNEMVDETKGLREDMAVRDNVEWQVRVEKDIRIIKSKLGIR